MPRGVKQSVLASLALTSKVMSNRGARHGRLPTGVPRPHMEVAMSKPTRFVIALALATATLWLSGVGVLAVQSGPGPGFAPAVQTGPGP